MDNDEEIQDNLEEDGLEDEAELPAEKVRE